MTRPITDTLRLINGGTFLDQISIDLARTVQAINEHGGSGEITIKLTVKRAAGGAMAVSGKHAVKAPSPKADETLMWSTEDGGLVIENLKQQKLDLQVVADAKKPEASELRSVG